MTERTTRKAKLAAISKDLFPAGTGVDALEAALRRIAAQKLWPVPTPLPSSRFLGGRYRISFATANRLLKRLCEEKLIWHGSNGRYHTNESRLILEPRRPYACLLRRLQHWSRVYEGVMHGFSEAFGQDRTAMLMVHDESLVRHADTAHAPVHASAAAQREALREFFDEQGELRGILLDDVWLDEVLQDYAPRLSNAVVVCRPTTMASLSSVTLDFEQAAMLAVGHLYARGYEDILVAVPFRGAAPIDKMLQAMLDAANRLGRPIKAGNVRSVASPDERAKLVASLRQAKTRTGVFCPEDNVSALLWEALDAAGVRCPERVGFLAGMGTGLVKARNISSLVIDYDRIGRLAGEVLRSGRHSNKVVNAELVTGATT